MKRKVAAVLLFIIIFALVQLLCLSFWAMSPNSTENYLDFLSSTWLLFDILFSIISFVLIWYGWHKVQEKELDWFIPHPLIKLESKLMAGEKREPEWFHTPHPRWIDYKGGCVTRRRIVDDIEESFENSTPEYSHIQLIVAQPGAGKTTIAHFLGFERIREEIEKENAHLVSFYDRKEIVTYCDLNEVMDTDSVRSSLISSVGAHIKTRNTQSRLLIIIDNVQSDESVGKYVFETFRQKQRTKVQFLLLARPKQENVQQYACSLKEKFSMELEPITLSKERFEEVVSGILVEYKKLQKEQARDMSVIIAQKAAENLWMVKFILGHLERIGKFTVQAVREMTFEDIKEEVRDYYLEGDDHSVFHRTFKEISVLRKNEFLRLLITVSEFTKRDVSIHEEFLYIERNQEVDTENIVIRLCEQGELIRSEDSTYVSLPHTTLANCVLTAFEDEKIQTPNELYLNYILFCARKKPIMPIANAMQRLLLAHRRGEGVAYSNKDLAKSLEDLDAIDLADIASTIAYEISNTSDPRFADYIPDYLLQMDEVSAIIKAREDFYAQRLIRKDDDIERAFKHLGLTPTDLDYLAIPPNRESHLDIIVRFQKLGILNSPLPSDSLIRLRLVEILPSLLKMIKGWSTDFKETHSRVPRALHHIVEILIEYVDFSVRNCDLPSNLQKQVTSTLNDKEFIGKLIDYIIQSSWRRCGSNPYVSAFNRHLKSHLDPENVKMVLNAVSNTLDPLTPIWCLLSELEKVVHHNWEPGDIQSSIRPFSIIPVTNSLEKLIQLDTDIQDSIKEILEGMIEFVNNHGNYESAKLTEQIKNTIDQDQYATPEEKERILDCIVREPSPNVLFEIWRIIDCFVGNLHKRFIQDLSDSSKD